MEYTYQWKEAFEMAFKGKRKLLDEHISHFYTNKLFPLIKTKVKSGDLAHEVCSSTIAKFWKKFYVRKDALPENVNGYLYTMANNSVFYSFKMKKKEREVVNKLKNSTLKDIILGNAVEKDFTQKSEKEEMYQALDTAWIQMDEKCQKLLKLNILERQTIRSIAPTMSFPSENAATQKKVSCLKKLRKLAYLEFHRQGN